MTGPTFVDDGKCACGRVPVEGDGHFADYCPIIAAQLTTSSAFVTAEQMREFSGLKETE